MKKGFTTKEFITYSRMVHGDKYNYDKVVTVDGITKVEIICPIHGSFMQSKYDHINGCGCPTCGLTKNKKTRKVKNHILYGVGINDYDGFISIDGIVLKSYSTWREMIRRCYEKYDESNHNFVYNDCSVCDEWLHFSNFKKWFDKYYIDGYQLDKDILVKGNKVYSPETCCFVPQEINKLLTLRNRNRGKYPIGISKQGNGFICSVNNKGKHVYLGYFSNIDEAFKTYKKEKEQHIKELAQEYFEQGKITEKVYKALLNYKVEIID